MLDIKKLFTKIIETLNDKADSTDLADYLPLTGGTLTGAVSVTGDVTSSGEVKDGSNNKLSDALFEDANGDISITRNITAGGEVVATLENKNIVYTGECVTLAGNQDASKSAGQITLSQSSTYTNCLPASKYSVSRSSTLANDIMTASSTSSAGSITINKAGRYRVDFQVYMYSGYTLNDQITAGILVGGSSSANRAIRTRAFNANPYMGLAGACVAEFSANDVLTLGATNQQGARGIVGLSAYTRMTVECLDIYE